MLNTKKFDTTGCEVTEEVKNCSNQNDDAEDIMKMRKDLVKYRDFSQEEVDNMSDDDVVDEWFDVYTIEEKRDELISDHGYSKEEVDNMSDDKVEEEYEHVWNVLQLKDFGYPEDMEKFISYMPISDEAISLCHTIEDNRNYLLLKLDDFIKAKQIKYQLLR